MAKFTFKFHRGGSGRYASFFNDWVDIKLKRGVIGSVSDKKPYKIRLMIKQKPTKVDPAPFKWITLKREFESLNECKLWLEQNTDRILSQFDLYQQFE